LIKGEEREKRREKEKLNSKTILIHI